MVLLYPDNILSITHINATCVLSEPYRYLFEKSFQSNTVWSSEGLRCGKTLLFNHTAALNIDVKNRIYFCLSSLIKNFSVFPRF